MEVSKLADSRIIAKGGKEIHYPGTNSVTMNPFPKARLCYSCSKSHCKK